MSPPSFSSETTQVLRGYGLAFSSFLSPFESALSASMGAQRKPATSTAAVIFSNVFIIFCFNRYPLYKRMTKNTPHFLKIFKPFNSGGETRGETCKGGFKNLRNAVAAD